MNRPSILGSMRGGGKPGVTTAAYRIAVTYKSSSSVVSPWGEIFS
jgi:hypothetical protein